MLYNIRRPKLRFVALIVLVAAVIATIVTAAFGSDEGISLGVVVEWIQNDDDNPTSVPSTPPNDGQPDNVTRTQEPIATVDTVLSGFSFPIAGGCLPDSDTLMPGAPREYRQGIHEGIDFYESDNCAFVGQDTEVLAAKAGTVVRADWTYEDLTEELLAELEAQIAEAGGASAEIEDVFRGRQVWIEHADGTVTRYAHLAGIVEDLEVGTAVAQGELVAYVGESGTPESVREPGTQAHMHFEIRIGESYLGAGLGADAVRALYQAAFSPA